LDDHRSQNGYTYGWDDDNGMAPSTPNKQTNNNNNSGRTNNGGEQQQSPWPSYPAVGYPEKEDKQSQKADKSRDSKD